MQHKVHFSKGSSLGLEKKYKEESLQSDRTLIEADDEYTFLDEFDDLQRFPVESLCLIVFHKSSVKVYRTDSEEECHYVLIISKSKSIGPKEFQEKYPPYIHKSSWSPQNALSKIGSPK